MDDSVTTYAAFSGDEFFTRGGLAEVLSAVKTLESKDAASILLFDEHDGKQVDFDLRGSLEEVLHRLETPAVRAVGRPKLGVSSREVTLLPKHWAWLETQRGGASGTLRRLVDTAMLAAEPGPSAAAIDAIYRTMSAVAGNQPGFEDASRALYRRDWDRFLDIIKNWSGDLGAYFANRLSLTLSAE